MTKVSRAAASSTELHSRQTPSSIPPASPKGSQSPSPMATASPGSSRPSSPNVIQRPATLSTPSPKDVQQQQQQTTVTTPGGSSSAPLSPSSSGSAGRPPLPNTPSTFSRSPSTARLVSHMNALSVSDPSPLPSDVPGSAAQVSPSGSSSASSTGTMSSSASTPSWVIAGKSPPPHHPPPEIDTTSATIGTIPPPKNASPSSEAAHAAALALANRLKRTREDVIAVTTPPTSNHTNVFVKYLPPDLDDAGLCKLFARFGHIKSCKVMVDHQTGHSLGYGFVRYTSQSEAKQAIAAMNGHQMGSKTLLCKFSNTTPETKTQEPSPNLYIKPLLPSTREADLHRVFSRYGEIVEARVMMDKTTKQSRQIGFVRFASQEAATKALESLSGTRIAPEAAPLLIKYAESERSKSERKARRAASPPNSGSATPTPAQPAPSAGPARPPAVAIPDSSAQPPQVAYQLAMPSPGGWMGPGAPMMAYPTTPSGDPYGYGMSPMLIYQPGYPVAMSPAQNAPHHFALPSPAPYHGPQSPMDTPQSAPAWDEGTNLFVFHLPSSMGDSGLHDLFKQFGTIESVKVVTDRATGDSKGYGFVKFARAVDAMTAMNQMNGFSVEGKHLKVSLKTPPSSSTPGAAAPSPLPAAPGQPMAYPQVPAPYTMAAYPMSPYGAPHQAPPHHPGHPHQMQVPYGAVAVPVMTVPQTPTMASSPRSTQSFSAWSSASPRANSPDSVGTSSLAPSATTDEGEKDSPRSAGSGSLSVGSGRSKQIYRPPPVQAREAAVAASAAAAAARASSPPPTMYTMVPVPMQVMVPSQVPATTTSSSSAASSASSSSSSTASS